MVCGVEMTGKPGDLRLQILDGANGLCSFFIAQHRLAGSLIAPLP